MDSWHWRRWGGVALVVFGLFAVAVGSAQAGDDNQPEGAAASSTTTVIVTKNGGKTVRLVQGEDGRFIVEPMGDAGSVRERVVEQIAKDYRGATRTVHGQTVEVELEGSSGAPSPSNPMSSVMKWMMKRHGDYADGNDPVTAWFQGGDDVPLADLRDTLVADGWTASSLLEWLHQDLSGALAALLAPALGDMSHMAPPHAVTPHAMPPHAMPPHGMPPRGQGRGMHRGGMAPPRMMGGGGRQGRRAGRGPDSPMARAIVIWNDGDGWRTQEIDQAVGHAQGPRRGGRGRMGGMRGQGRGRMQAAEHQGCNCPDCPQRGRRGRGMGAGQRGDGLPPALRRMLEESASGRPGAMIFPGEVSIEREIKVLEQDLDGLLGELGVLMPTLLKGTRKGGCGGDCDSCPNKSACAGGSCDEKAGARKAGCCGQCDGDCASCPCRDGGKNCGGDCDSCPNKGACASGSCGEKAGARKAGCCGQCDGDCANCPCRDGGKNCADDCGCKTGGAAKGCCGQCDGDCANCPCNKTAAAKECCGSCGGKTATAPQPK